MTSHNVCFYGALIEIMTNSTSNISLNMQGSIKILTKLICPPYYLSDNFGFKEKTAFVMFDAS